MVMSMAKITAGDGYTYLTRHVAHGDAPGQGKRDATDYYTAQGNPPGRWIGRGAPLLSLADQEVTEDQMRMLFGHGAHPDGEAMIAAYITAHTHYGMTGLQLEQVRQDAIRHATLGRQFPAYKTIEDHDARVAQRLQVIREETGREPTQAEEKKVRAEESRRHRAPVAGFDLDKRRGTGGGRGGLTPVVICDDGRRLQSLGRSFSGTGKQSPALLASWRGHCNPSVKQPLHSLQRHV